jgi:hypothetical protein
LPKAVAAKKLSVGDVFEAEGRSYDVVAGRAGGVTLEPTIAKTVDEIHAGARRPRMPPEDFDELFGQLPPEGER